MRRVALIALLAASLTLAGCLGGGGDDGSAGTASSDAGDQQTQDAADNVTAENETGSDTPDFAWNQTSFSGDAPGPNLVFVFTPGPTHNVTVVDGTTNLTINASSGNGELLVDIYPPGCEEQDNQRGEPCSHEADTDGGEGTWATDDPDPGTWTLRVSKADPGTGSTSYDVTADRLEPFEDS